jgi:integrase
MINRENYLAVKDYLKFKVEVQQRDQLSVNLIYSQLKLVLRWLDDCPLTDAPAKRPVLPKWVAALDLVYKPGVKVSNQWVKDVCDTTRAYVKWLRVQDPSKYSVLSLSWLETLVPGRILEEPPEERQVVTPDMVRKLIAIKGDPADTALKRDKAAAAFLFLSGMRATAFVSLPIECVDIAKRDVRQYPTQGVRTKNRRAAKTTLLNIPDLLDVVQEWDTYIRATSSPDDLWYAPMRWACTTNVLIQNQVIAQKAETVPPHRAQSLRRAFRVLFQLADLPYMHPHLFRHGHAVYGLKNSNTIEEYKAVSMNLMHSNIGITDTIYAMLPSNDMKAAIEHLGHHVREANPMSPDAAHQLAILKDAIEQLGHTVSEASHIVSPDAVHQLAILLIQHLSDLKGGDALT